MVADSNMLPIGDKQTLIAILKFQGEFDGPKGRSGEAASWIRPPVASPGMKWAISREETGR